jgi:tRNA 2-thiouridine synthesizing protein C
MTIMAAKRFLFVHRKAPYGGGLAGEMLDAALTAAAFGAEVHLAFLDDGVFHLLKRQCPDAVGGKDLTETLIDLGDCDIDQVWVEGESLARRGLRPDDLIIAVSVIDARSLAQVMDGMDVVFSA